MLYHVTIDHGSTPGATVGHATMHEWGHTVINLHLNTIEMMKAGKLHPIRGIPAINRFRQLQVDAVGADNWTPQTSYGNIVTQYEVCNEQCKTIIFLTHVNMQEYLTWCIQ